MAKLIITKPGSSPVYRRLDNEKLMVGREEGCQIRFEDSNVSKRHAMIYSLGNDDIVEDLGSTNGTRLNGQTVSRHILQDHDIIEIAGYRIEYINQRAQKSMDADMTMMVDSSMLSAALTGSFASRDDAPKVNTTRDSRAKPQPGRLMGLEGAMAGQQILLDKLITPLGRVTGHTPAAVVKRPQGYMVLRVADTAKVRVNGKGIGDAWKMLANDDIIEFGSERFSFFFE